ncbi:MAG: hypothetical protein HWN66_22350 [Candidatus Helarchaeota archaeon]|nr:hypothetical protein [Candidatus Helarchaeota archaeon]
MHLTILWEGAHHREAILAILRASPQRIRLTTLNLHDFDLDGGIKFSEKIVRMVNRGVKVTIVIGCNPFDMARQARKKPVYQKYLKSLKKIVDTNRVNAYHHTRIHAKVLFAEAEDSASAIVTSANFTPTGLSAGLKGNREVGCHLSDLDEKSKSALKEATREMIELARRNPLKRDLDQILTEGGM